MLEWVAISSHLPKLGIKPKFPVLTGGFFTAEPLWKPTLYYQFSLSVVSDSLRSHEPQHTRPRCPSPTPRVYSNSCPLSRWRHPTISPSVTPFSSCLQSFLASGSFQVSQFFASGGQSFGVSASASAYLYVKSFTNVSHSVRNPISKISDPTFSQ